MKKKKILFGILILVFVIVIVGILIIKNNNNNISGSFIFSNQPQIIAESSYKNYAWGFQFNGKAILSDGSIYKWNISNNDYSTDIPSDIDKYTNWILENGTKSESKVSNDDLEKIQKYILELEDNIETTNTAMDAGSSSIKVWNENKEKIILKESGDFSGENTTSASQNLIALINKYLK
jgi:hypothetical protein